MAKSKIANGIAFALPGTNSAPPGRLLQICGSPKCPPTAGNGEESQEDSQREERAFLRPRPRGPVLHLKAGALRAKGNPA